VLEGTAVGSLVFILLAGLAAFGVPVLISVTVVAGTAVASGTETRGVEGSEAETSFVVLRKKQFSMNSYITPVVQRMGSMMAIATRVVTMVFRPEETVYINRISAAPPANPAKEPLAAVYIKKTRDTTSKTNQAPRHRGIHIPLMAIRAVIAA
jgi:hypothetical protein